MSILFFLLFIFYSFGQLGRISLYNQQINFYVYELFLIFILLIFFVKYKLQPIIKNYKLNKFLALFILFITLSYFINIFFFNLFENLISFLYLLRLITYIIFFIYLHFYISKEKNKKGIFKNSLFVSFILIFIFSITQYFFYPDLRNLIYLGWDPHLNRLFGVFFDTSITAGLLGLIFLFLFLNKKVAYSVLFLILFILTYSRSAFISLIVAVFYYLFYKKDFKKILFFLILFFLIFLITPKKFGVGVALNRLFSIEARLNDYKEAVAVWKKSPLLGYGYNRTQFIRLKSQENMENSNVISHSLSSFSSSYLTLLAASGILGLVLFTGFLVNIWKKNIKYRPYLLFILLFSFADNILLHPFIIFLFGVITVLI